MARNSPLNAAHGAAGALDALYGPPERGIAVVQVYRSVGSEYAAIRRTGGALLLDQPQRATLEVRGADRIEFLNRMVTQELKTMAPLTQRRGFWLNRKGRIDGDLRLIETGETHDWGGAVWIDVDAHTAERVAATLGAFLFAEDVAITDRTEAMHRLALHGDGAAGVIDAASEVDAGRPARELADGQAASLRVAGRRVLVDRQDSCGVPGFELLMAVGDAESVYLALAREPKDMAMEGDAIRALSEPPDGRAVRGAWHAYNIARIESGWPLFNLDFGHDSLPHETGVLADRVSFKKGCYLGQEVVARMESLGHPKQRLVALRPAVGEEPVAGDWAQPETGSPVMTGDDAGAEVVGAVTSSTISPMLGSTPVCFAMVKYKHSAPGTVLYPQAVSGGGGSTRLRMVVQESLRLWTPAASGSSTGAA